MEKTDDAGAITQGGDATKVQTFKIDITKFIPYTNAARQSYLAAQDKARALGAQTPKAS